MSEQSEVLVQLTDVAAAADRLTGLVRRTPLVPLDLGTEAEPVWLKAESLQLSGSFKIRGALNAVALLSDDDRARGVVTHSSGNHGQALARAAAAHGIPATVVMPLSTPAVKQRLTADQGATIVLVDPADRASRVAEIRAETGAVFVPPFDDPHIVAGQGTIGLEVCADLPGAGTVYVPVSGGGLISGIAVAVKSLSPTTRVVAVEPELAGDLAESWQSGRLVSWPADVAARTIADGLRVQGVGELNWRHIQALVDDVVTVTEDEIVDALRRIVLDAKLVCEPSGAVALAGTLKVQAHGPGSRVAIVSGGNVDPVWLAGVLAS